MAHRVTSRSRLTALVTLTMHICFVCGEYPPSKHGGVGTFTQTLARALVAQGHQVSCIGVYLAAADSEENDQGVRVVRLANARVRGTGFIVNSRRFQAKLRRLHRETPIDVIEGPEVGLFAVPARFPAAKIIRMNGGHRFFTVTLGEPPQRWHSWIEKRSFAHADFLCAVSRYVAEETRKLLHLGDRPITILPNPVDVTRFKPNDSVPEEAGLIVFAGTVVEKKGVRQLVQAMPQIVQAVPQAHLVVAGRDTVDSATGKSFTEHLRALVPHELRDKIEFRGAVANDQLPELMARAVLCVYPSHMEALPLAWLEGLAMGKAVVASRTGPGPEVIEDGVSGLLCDPHDPASIAAAIVRVLADDELRKRLGKAARAAAVEKFAIDVLVARNEAFYEQCLQQCRERHAR